MNKSVKCQLCGVICDNKYFDVRSTFGPFNEMCQDCHRSCDEDHKSGRCKNEHCSQRYDRQPDGTWKKACNDGGKKA